MKRRDLPAMPFYIGDWKKDPGVQCLNWEEKRIWFEMICLMWESKERGYLKVGDQNITNELLASLLGLDNLKVNHMISKFESLNLFSRREADNCIYSRKIVKLLELIEKRREAGRKGGNPNLISLTSGYPTGLSNAETENEDETVNEPVNKESKAIKEYNNMTAEELEKYNQDKQKYFDSVKSVTKEDLIKHKEENCG